jgi:uncharacterized membrane protein
VVRILALLAAGWVALLALSPWLPVPIAGVLYLFGGRICHQLTERSFALAGAQLPVCARCLGIYVGAAAGLTLPGPRRMARAALRHPARVRGVIIALAMNAVTLWSASNAVRAAAGFALGFVIARVIGTVDYERWPSPRRIAPAPPQPHL